MSQSFDISSAYDTLDDTVYDIFNVDAYCSSLSPPVSPPEPVPDSTPPVSHSKRYPKMRGHPCLSPAIVPPSGIAATPTVSPSVSTKPDKGKGRLCATASAPPASPVDPRLPMPPSYDSVATCVFTDNCFLLRVRSRTLCAQWMCHALSGLAYLVLPYHRLTHSYVSFSSYVFPLTRTNVDCRLVTGYLLAFRFSFCLVDSSTYVSHLRLSLFVLSTRLPSRYFWTLTRY